MVFAAYLRGIETDQGRKYDADNRPRLQPTYEGLKRTCASSQLIGCASFAAYLRGIETQDGPGYSREELIGLQPTYEELKL